eukprot:UC4_evm7s1462
MSSWLTRQKDALRAKLNSAMGVSKEIVEQTDSTGKKYKGEVVDGKRHGKGRLEFPDGRWFDGEFANNKMHGKGLYYKNGKMFDVVFKEGKLEDKKPHIKETQPEVSSSVENSSSSQPLSSELTTTKTDPEVSAVSLPTPEDNLKSLEPSKDPGSTDIPAQLQDTGKASDNNVLQEKIKMLEKELKIKDDEIAGHLETSLHMAEQLQMATMSAGNNASAEELSNLREEHEKLKVEFKVISERNENISTEKELLVIEADSKAAKAEAEIAQLKVSLGAAESKLLEVSKDVEACSDLPSHETVAQLEASLSDVSAKSKASEEEIEKLNKLLSAKNEDLTNREGDIKKLQENSKSLESRFDTASSELATNSKKLESLEKELEASRNEANTLTQGLENYKNKNIEAQAKLATMTAEIESLQKKIADSDTSEPHEGLTNASDTTADGGDTASKATLDALRAEVIEMKSERAKMFEKIASFQSKIEDLESEKDKLSNDAEKSAGEAETLRASLSEKESELIKCQNNIRDLEQSVGDLQVTAKSNSTEQEARVEEVSTLTQKLNDVILKECEAQKKVETQNAEIEELSNELNNFRSEIDSYKASVAEDKKKLVSLQEELTESKKNILLKNKELKGMREKEESNLEKMESQSNELELLRGKQDELETKLSATRDTASKTSRNIDEYVAKILKLEDNEKKLTEELEKATARASDLDKKEKDLSKNLEEKSENMESLNVLISREQIAKEEAQSKVLNLEEKLNEINEDASNIKDLFKIVNAEKEKLQSQLAEMTDLRDEAIAKEAASNMKKELVEGQLQDLRELHGDIEQMLIESKTSLKSMEEEAKITSERLEFEKLAIQDERDTIREKYETIEKNYIVRLDDETKAREQAEINLLDLERDQAEHASVTQGLREDINELQNQYDEARKEIQALQAELESKNSKIDELLENIDDANVAKTNVDDELRAAQEAIEKLKVKLRQMSSKLRRLGAENNKFKESMIKEYEISIPVAILKKEKKDKHHVYKVVCSCREDTWTIFRRYSEFRDMWSALKKEGKITGVESVPFPQKKTMSSTKTKVAENRREGLELFAQRLFELLAGGALKGKMNRENIFSVANFFAPTSADKQSSSSSSLTRLPKLRCKSGNPVEKFNFVATRKTFFRHRAQALNLTPYGSAPPCLGKKSPKRNHKAGLPVPYLLYHRTPPTFSVLENRKVTY